MKDPKGMKDPGNEVATYVGKKILRDAWMSSAFTHINFKNHLKHNDLCAKLSCAFLCDFFCYNFAAFYRSFDLWNHWVYRYDRFPWEFTLHVSTSIHPSPLAPSLPPSLHPGIEVRPSDKLRKVTLRWISVLIQGEVSTLSVASCYGSRD